MLSRPVSPHLTLLVTSFLTWAMFLQSETPPALAVSSWQPAGPSGGSAVQDAPSADPVTGAVVQWWQGWGYHWLTTSWLKRAGRRRKLWFMRMLCYFCPCLYPLWFHFLNQCRSVHSLRILYVQSSHLSCHPHLLPDLPVVLHRDWSSLIWFLFRGWWCLVLAVINSRRIPMADK